LNAASKPSSSSCATFSAEPALPIQRQIGGLDWHTDYIAAYLIPGAALPVGVVTGAAGAPFLIWLLISRNRQGNGG